MADMWTKEEAIVQLTDWLSGFIDGELSEDAQLATDLKENLLRPALVALHPIHAGVKL